MAPTPGNNSPAGSASTGGFGSSAGPTLIRGNVNPNNELKVTIVTSSTPVNSGANNLIVQTLTPYKVIALLGAAVADQTNTTITSNMNAGTQEGLNDFYRFMNLDGLSVTYIRMVTTNTALYTGSNLYYGIMPFNGTTQPGYWPLTNYAKNGPSGYLNDLVIDTMPDGTAFSLPLTPQTYMYFDVLPVSTTINMFFGINGTGDHVIVG